MIANVRRIFSKVVSFYHSRKSNPFPFKVVDLWYCGMWYKYREKPLFAIEGEPCFDPFTTVERKTCCIDDLVPVMRIGDSVGLYKVESMCNDKHASGDLALWDNGKLVTLSFVRAVNYRFALQLIFRKDKARYKIISDDFICRKIIRMFQDIHQDAKYIRDWEFVVKYHPNIPELVLMESNVKGLSEAVVFTVPRLFNGVFVE